MKIIKANAAGFENFFRELRQRGGSHSPELLSSVAEIVRDVAARGDEALFQYTAKFDGYKLTAATVEVTPRKERKRWLRSSRKIWKLLKLAARRIEKYHRHQIVKGWSAKTEEKAWNWDSGFCPCGVWVFMLPAARLLILRHC